MTTKFKAKPTFALRLPLTMRPEAVEIAKREGLSLNQFVRLAVAEKIARLEFLQSESVDSKSV